VVAKRCICGRSKEYPLCDGSHRSSDSSGVAWQCEPSHVDSSAQGFAAGAANHNLAERLAFERGGIAAHLGPPDLRVERLVVLLEGGELDEVLPTIARVRPKECVVWALTEAGASAAAAISGALVVRVDDPGISLWTALGRAERDSCAAVPPRPLDAVFLSHAVADEPSLHAPLERLRRAYGVDVFQCGDSIAPGAEWEATIFEELSSRPCFVLALSRASAASSYCAFEVGAARALRKRIVVVALDETSPPAFVQHLQALSIERRMRARPWLDRTTALTEALVEAMGAQS
jgi:hypothetical protein